MWRKREIANSINENTTMKKLVKNGLVAVLVSPGYGAGWSTWNKEKPEMLFDPEIVQLIEEAASTIRIEAQAAVSYPDCYIGGVDDLIVQWIPQGTQFRINEYDGDESLEIRDDIQWNTA